MSVGGRDSREISLSRTKPGVVSRLVVLTVVCVRVKVVGVVVPDDLVLLLDGLNLSLGNGPSEAGQILDSVPEPAELLARLLLDRLELLLEVADPALGLEELGRRVGRGHGRGGRVLLVRVPRVISKFCRVARPDISAQ